MVINYLLNGMILQVVVSSGESSFFLFFFGIPEPQKKHDRLGSTGFHGKGNPSNSSDKKKEMKLTIYTHQEPVLEPWQDEKKDPMQKILFQFWTVFSRCKLLVWSSKKHPSEWESFFSTAFSKIIIILPWN